MEFVKDKWYLILAAVFVIALLYRKSGSGVTEIGAGSDFNALASIASNERENDENRRVGLISSLLGYDLSLRQLTAETALANRNLDQQIDLAKISANAQTASFENQMRLAQMGYNAQLQQSNAANALQRYYMEQQFGRQNRNDWLAAISGGLQTILPMIFGNQTSGGSVNPPQTPPIFGGGWSFGW